MNKKEKISRHFYNTELVPPEIFNSKNPAIWFIDKLWVNNVLDVLVDKYGPMMINNWANNGSLKNCGFRVPTCKTGAELSQHKFKTASDLHPLEMSTKELYEKILDEEEFWLNQGLTTMEDIDHTQGWIHIDGRWTMLDRILIVKPK